MNKDVMRKEFEAWWESLTPQTRSIIGSRHIALLGWQAALSQQQAGEDELVKALEEASRVLGSMSNFHNCGILADAATAIQQALTTHRARKGE